MKQNVKSALKYQFHGKQKHLIIHPCKTCPWVKSIQSVLLRSHSCLKVMFFRNLKSTLSGLIQVTSEKFAAIIFLQLPVLQRPQGTMNKELSTFPWSITSMLLLNSVMTSTCATNIKLLTGVTYKYDFFTFSYQLDNYFNLHAHNSWFHIILFQKSN